MNKNYVEIGRDVNGGIKFKGSIDARLGLDDCDR